MYNKNTDCTASLHEFFSCFFIYFCRFWTIQMINFSKPFNEWRTHKRLLLLRIWMEMQKIFFAIIQFHLEHFSFKFELFSFRIICTPRCVCILHVSHLASFFPYLNSLHRRNTFFLMIRGAGKRREVYIRFVCVAMYIINMQNRFYYLLNWRILNHHSIFITHTIGSCSVRKLVNLFQVLYVRVKYFFAWGVWNSLIILFQ